MHADGQLVRQADGVHLTFTGGNIFASTIWPVAAALGRTQMRGDAADPTPV